VWWRRAQQRISTRTTFISIYRRASLWLRVALRASTTPQLWVLGSDDLEAPSKETAARIKSLIADGKDYTLAVYPGAEHGLTEYELDAKGERVSTRFVPGYFAMMRDFIRDGLIEASYGKAEITRPRSH